MLLISDVLSLVRLTHQHEALVACVSVVPSYFAVKSIQSTTHMTSFYPTDEATILVYITLVMSPVLQSLQLSGLTCLPFVLLICFIVSCQIATRNPSEGCIRLSNNPARRRMDDGKMIEAFDKADIVQLDILIGARL